MPPILRRTGDNRPAPCPRCSAAAAARRSAGEEVPRLETDAEAPFDHGLPPVRPLIQEVVDAEREQQSAWKLQRRLRVEGDEALLRRR